MDKIEIPEREMQENWYYIKSSHGTQSSNSTATRGSFAHLHATWLREKEITNVMNIKMGGKNLFLFMILQNN